MIAKILAFAGSAQDSSTKLVKIAVEGVKAAGADATYLDFRDLPLPLYDGFEEAEGLPENALKLSPDSASGIPPRIQQFDHPTAENAIDWASRSEP